MAGRDGQVTQVSKSASTPPVYTAVVEYPALPADPGPPALPAQAAHTDEYIVDATDFVALSPHINCSCKVTATGTNGGAIGSYSVKK